MSIEELATKARETQAGKTLTTSDPYAGQILDGPAAKVRPTC